MKAVGIPAVKISSFTSDFGMGSGGSRLLLPPSKYVEIAGFTYYVMKAEKIFNESADVV